MKKLSYRNDFNPISVWIIDKIDSHRRIFVANASHLFMFLMKSIILICLEGKMEFFISKVIRLFSVAHPSQFKSKAGTSVSKIYNLEASVTGILFADNRKTNCFFLKSDTLF